MGVFGNGRSEGEGVSSRFIVLVGEELTIIIGALSFVFCG